MKNNVLLIAFLGCLLSFTVSALPVDPRFANLPRKPCSPITGYLLTVKFGWDVLSRTDKGNEWFQNKIKDLKTISSKNGIIHPDITANYYTVFFTERGVTPMYQYEGNVSILLDTTPNSKNFMDQLNKERYRVDVQEVCRAEENERNSVVN